MDLSIIIINWNTYNLTYKCIDSIKISNYKYEIILVNNSSNDAIKIAKLKNIYNNLKIIQNKENIYFAKANNRAYSEAKGRYILLLGSDTRILNDAIDQLIKFLDTNSKYSIVSPQLINSDGSIQRSCRNFPTVINVFKSLFDINQKSRFFGEYKLSYWDHNDSMEVVQPQATCILIRKEIIDKYGLFDEKFPLYFNDVDFFRKMKKFNIKTYFLSTAKIIHFYGQSTRKLRWKRKLLLYTGYINYIKKWGLN
jgi:hypothetical protein